MAKLESFAYGRGEAWEPNAFHGTPRTMTMTVPDGSIGWSGGVSPKIPATWQDRKVVTVSGKSHTPENETVVITNIVVHYVSNSIQPDKAIPASMDAGFVNVITEVKSGGAVSVPVTWALNYPNYVAKFGSDFTKSLTKPTGKRDGSGNAMLVWQDYVAGTDPTDESDVFMASIMMVGGVPKISYSPEFKDASEAAMRKYTTYGKKSLADEQWVEIPAGREADYNFFKVTVEMK